VVGISYYPLGCLLEPDAVDGRDILSPLINPLIRDDYPHRLEPLQRATEGGAITHAAAAIKDPPISGRDTPQELVERDGISVLLETERAPDDVQERFKFSLLELGEHLIKVHIGALGGIGRVDAVKLKL
jgi:hypothetical protein